MTALPTGPITPRQLAEQIADWTIAEGDTCGSFSVEYAPDYNERDPSPVSYEDTHGDCPDARIDRDGARDWLIAALLAGYGVACFDDPDNWAASAYKLSYYEEDHRGTFIDEDWP